MQTVLLAAGDGERLEPLSASVPKPLLPVGGDPLLVRVARRAVAAGATDLVVVVPPYYQPFARALGETVEGVPVTYAVQPRPMGTANALVVTRTHLDSDFVVLPGDTIYDDAALRSLYANVPTVGVRARDEPATDPVVVGDGGPLDVGSLADEGTGAYVDAGACSLPAEAKHWTRPPTNDAGERDLAAVVERTANGHDLRPVVVDDHVDVDAPGDLLAANRRAFDEWADRSPGQVADGSVHEMARLHGPVHVEPGASVACGAVVEGPAIVAAGARVEADAYVRPYSYVGPKVVVGHGSEVSACILLSDATVGSQSTLADSVVGPDADVGARTNALGPTCVPDALDADARTGSQSTPTPEFGVVVGESATVGDDVHVDPGVVVPRYATVDAGTRLTDGDGR
ncbi:sugar phosphate nucleotidyltransferase [Halorubellus sp. PRR65]|uniref:sugar phosphate nucleotidyltransferase n=1 Tax=Halorubellus sp. PRR65 TaxID=3098148 RepID=UPI002B25A247|nr:sugar phosphate nucleotidyltransferase [Halorubellus sp. PRR65]